MKHICFEKRNGLLFSPDRESADFRFVCFDGMDLSGYDLRGLDFTNASFVNANLSGANLTDAVLVGVNVNGANLYGANLEGAVIKHVISNDDTKFFRLYCPESGPFVAWKKCFNHRVVQLLIPADAKRSSSTYNACRCDKAKVLSIKSIDFSLSYKEAFSYVDENFIYRVGEMAYAGKFCEDRWKDSTDGIHFYMTRDEAVGYL